MEVAARKRLDIVAAVGLAVGGVFGIAGTFIGYASLRQLFWTIDGVGIVIAAALLAFRYFRAGNDCVAAGFLVLLAGESLLLAGTAAGLQGSVRADGFSPEPALAGETEVRSRCSTQRNGS